MILYDQPEQSGDLPGAFLHRGVDLLAQTG